MATLTTEKGELKTKEDKKLIGSETKERLLTAIEGGVQAVYERAQEDDPTSLSDEAARLGVGTAELVGNVAGAPVIKQTLSVLDFPFWVARQSAGGVLEHGFGVDPFYGQAAVGVGEVFLGGKGLVSGATKGAKLAKKGAFASRYAVQETVDAARAARLARKGKLWQRPGADNIPIDRSDVFKADDLSYGRGPNKKTYTQTHPRTAYPQPKNIPPDPWNPPDLQAHLVKYINSQADVVSPPSPSLEDVLRIHQGDMPDTIRRWSDGSVSQNPLLHRYKREDAAKIGQGLQDAVPDKPSAATIWDKKMDDIYNLLTNRDPDLPTAGVEKLQGIPLGGRAPGPKFIKHHPAPLAHIARSLDYLSDEGVMKGADYLSKKIGFKLGDFQPGTLAPDKFHSKMHRFLDDRLGSSKGGLLYKLEEKYADKFVKMGAGKKLSEGVSLEVRIGSGFMDELADVIVEQKNFIDDWYRALANRAEFKKVSIEEYVNEAAETVKADKVLKAIETGKTTKDKGISDLLDELIGLENKELRDTMKDLQQLSGVDDLLLSPENRHLKKTLLFKAKQQFLNEIMYMDWAGMSMSDARKKIFKLIDDYDLPFETDRLTPEQFTDQIVESLHNLNIDESLDPRTAKEIKEWLGRN